MTDPDPRVSFERISKRYPGVQALDGVSFQVAPGSVHAVVGENGAGKSTLMKILSGATRADEGAIGLDGQVVQLHDTRHAQDCGIAIVHQELRLATDLSVSENVFLGRWPTGSVSGVIEFREMHSAAERLFDSLKVRIDVRRRVSGLGIAQQQMVEIAKALALRARVLVLDEPSAVLTPHELEALFGLIRRLTRESVSIIYISHRLEEIFDLADRVTVLRDGQHISTRPIQEVKRDQLIHDIVGRPLEEEFPFRSVRLGDIVISVSQLNVAYRVRSVSFDVRAGEVFALTGLVGSGRSSVGRALFGALTATADDLRVQDRCGPFASPQHAQAAGLVYLPEDRKQQGLLLERSIRENITLAHLDQFARRGILQSARENEMTKAMIQELRIKVHGLEASVATLSGGNQQKVMLARWLQQHYPAIILDEPTRGVDVGAKAEIYALINDLAARGAAVVMITSEFPEAIGLADRIGVMSEGRLVGMLDNSRRNVTQDAILEYAVQGVSKGV